MELIIKPRAGGKTLEIIRRAEANPGYIVCFSHKEAARVARVAEEMGAKIPFPLSPGEFFGAGCYAHPSVRRAYIDNLDMVIQSMTGWPIEAVTWTEDTDADATGA